jgi:amino acid transporter
LVFLFRLARIALAAEELRLRYLIRRAIARAVLGAIAVILFLGVLIFGHIAAWDWLVRTMQPFQVALIFAGADLILGVILLFLALRSTPGAAERNALAVRERALDEAAESLTITAMVVRLIDLLIPPRAQE